MNKEIKLWMFTGIGTRLRQRILLPTRRFYNPYLKKRPIWSQPTTIMTTLHDSNNDTTLNPPAALIPGALKQPIVWIDCEMTGLDHINDKIIEVCCIITDGQLNVADEDGYESVIHYDKSIMDNMNEWCINQHGFSGLTQKVLDSVKTREQVEEELLNYIKKWIPDQRQGVLAGNSVHMDRLFMLSEFPKVIDHLFYRIIDVSSIMEVARRHNPQLASVTYKKKGAHTAKADILESIEQLKFYENHYFKNDTETKEFVDRRKAEIQREAENAKEKEDNKRDSEGNPELETSSQPEKKIKLDSADDSSNNVITSAR